MTAVLPYKQPWVRNPVYDTAYILCPPFLALFVVWLLPERFKHTNAMSLVGWCILILFVDVAHVYSTLYNTYFDKERFARRRILFTVTPILCYVAGAALYLAGGLVFWRTLAYLAVFHFIRQQYGFMRLYARADKVPKWFSFIDMLAIYAASIYPLIYWHCTPSLNFNWFVNNDFIIFEARQVKEAAFVLYVIIFIVYLVKEVILLFGSKHLNIPKNLIIIGTFISWYFGIVYFNGDMAFTLLNTVSHGIPYMALIWAGLQTNRTKNAASAVPGRGLAGRWYHVLIFLGSLFLLAYVEEGLWDGFVWRDHSQVFHTFSLLPQITDNLLLALLVPLLSLPQSTHYVLDGFIWRKKYA